MGEARSREKEKVVTTKIEWADLTINPVVGCSKCSPGCDNCYAERFAARLAKNPNTATKYAGVVDEQGRWTGKISSLDLSVFDRLPKKPCRVFVGSMTDIFHPGLDNNDGGGMLAMFKIMRMLPHTFMLLTKRSKRMKGDVEWLIDQDGELPDNIWPGATVCNQAEANEKIPLLLQTPAAKRFVSVEPMLGPVDLKQLSWKALASTAFKNALTGEVYIPGNCGESSQIIPGKKLDWVICGGETGPNARPVHPDWVRSLRDQCTAAGVPFFFKGWGEWGSTAVDMCSGEARFRTFTSFEHYCDKAPTWMRRGDMLICPDGHVPTHGGEDDKTFPMCVIRCVGKKRAGRLLDGREWNESPCEDG